jgi:NAD(P)-dependent dehydrogenase (short-subunit alcohol dehydrogenase family)
MRFRPFTVLALGLALLAPVRAASIALTDATVAQLQAAMTAGTLTAEKLTQLFLARIDAYEKAGPKLHAIITLNPKALDEARALDAERKAGKVRGPLHGIPILLKDNIDTADLPTTGGFYAPTKFAVRAVTDALRAELKSIGSPVQVACVSPGFVDTPLLDQYFRGREEVLQKTRESMTMLAPEDVASAIMTILEAPTHVEIGDILLRSSDQRM